MAALGADFYAFTGHKVYGPTGIGVLFGRRELLEAMPPFIGGGSMIKKVGREKITWADPPTRFEGGTPPIAEAVGLGAAIRWVDALGLEAIHAAEAELTAYALETPGRGRGPDRLRPARRATTAAASSPSPSRGSTATTSPRSSTATASPSAPATTAPRS